MLKTPEMIIKKQKPTKTEKKEEKRCFLKDSKSNNQD